jgi:hypothetical protein
VAGWPSLPATEKQVKKLKSFGFNIWNQLTKGEASHLIEECDRLGEVCPTPARNGSYGAKGNGGRGSATGRRQG